MPTVRRYTVTVYVDVPFVDDEQGEGTLEPLYDAK